MIPDILDVIEQCEAFMANANLENIQTITHHSVPNVKLQYPEPFIASPSIIHQDLWFMHILVYQYWLWFIFIFIIVFFFLTFLCTVRWCNNRSKPRRETRGVSRSKCGDLITAFVPVSWATSIIVSESTDAIDYYDGFGTTELVVGIRAYQWGWEYYYPRDLDLNYNLKKNYSTFVGNSLKYEKSSSSFSEVNNLWKFYKNKTSDQIITPSYLLLIPSDNSKIVNLLNFNDIGSSKLNESNAFKKIRMLSKTNNSDLYNSYEKLNNDFIKLFKINNLNNNTDSLSFFSKKQISFSNSLSFLNNTSFTLDYNSLNKIINYNLKLNTLKNNQNNKSIFFFKNKTTNLINDRFFFKSFQLINNNTDKKKTNISFIKFFSKNLNKNFNSKNESLSLNSLNFLNEFNSFNDKKDYFFNFDNKFFNNKKFKLSSSSQSNIFTDKNIRNLLNNNKYSQLFKIDQNAVLNASSNNFYKLDNDLLYFYKLSLLNWDKKADNSRLNSTRINVETPYSPIASNNLLIKNKNYDNLKTNLIFKGKEEATPLNLTSIYWNFYLNSVNNNWRIKNNINLNKIKDDNYLPQLSLYYDYDFRNWQALELLEDAFWENSFSIYLNDEYQELFSFNKDTNYYEKNLITFLAINSSLLANPNKFENTEFDNFFKEELLEDFDSKMSYFFQEDGIFDPFFTLKKNFNSLSFINNFNNSEESYEGFKNYFSLINDFNYNLFLTTSSFFNPISHSLVFNAFRSDLDDFNFFKEKNINFASFKFELIDLDRINVNSNRTTDVLNIRNTAKNSIITYNAMQKVFKTRLDEYRSHARIEDFSNSFSKQMFIDSNRITYENLLKKNKNYYFDTILYKNSSKENFNSFFQFDSSNNFYSFDFPFLLSLKSDSSRYLWFDWFSKWGFYEVQPSSSSKYAIFGMPYFNKVFEYSSNLNEKLNETENYFIRIARSRKNYITNWVYTPFMQVRNNSFFKNNDYFQKNNFIFEKNSVEKIKYTISTNSFYWKKIGLFKNSSIDYKYSNSGINTYTRSTWQPQNSIQSYYYNNVTLIDILSKREYLYRTFFLKKNNIVNLPLFLTNSPKNPLVQEIKISFNYIDPIIHRTEYSRDVYYYSLNHFNYLTLSSYLSFLNLNNTLNFSNSINTLFLYFKDSLLFNNNLKKNNNNELFKNQYRPMKKGITNMVRLHATGAIALPIEMRIQILASSKDVIHSWAIPSAGIKIDCVPGYSSHRVIIFLVSGIFWGQCMEICGRYHHWMPIVVFFMKRDLFFLWCTHFIFLNSNSSILSMNDRKDVNFARLVSYDKNNWIKQF